MKLYVLLDDYAGYGSRFLAQHGVSYLIDIGDIKILFDTGQDHYPILYNMRLLGLDPRDITHIFISHCHYDHTGGLLGILKEISKKIPVIAHPELFKKNIILEPSFREIGIPFNKEEIEKYSRLYLIKDSIKLSNKIFSTGEISNRMDFEKISIRTYTIKDGLMVEDRLLDDISLCIDDGDGLIIVSGCSHAGIISIVKRCIEVSGKKEVKAVVGGFHLIKASNERIKKTVEWLKRLHVKEIYTGHCTGLDAEAALKNEYKNRFHKLRSGMVIDL